MTKLVDTFISDEAHVEGTFAFIDMFDSTAYKANGEAAWITTMAWFYDRVGEIVERGGAGTVVKYLGDGVMVAYGPDGATAALNDAIEIQEALDDGVDGGRVRVSCSIGIATGDAVRFEIVPGHFDYLGLTVDCAARLCAAASPQAIFAATATTDSAQMNRVSSKVGAVLRRTPSEYKGEAQRAQLKGFSAPVEYHELLWSQQPFGLKSRYLTDNIEAEALRTSTPSREIRAGRITTVRGERGTRGVVRMWSRDNRRGFIDADDGEQLYTDTRFMVVEDALEAGEVVYFVPQPAPAEGKLRIAAGLIVLEQEVRGTVVALRDGFGFVRCTDERGTKHDVFMPLSMCEEETHVHMDVDFVVGETDRGARAEAVRGHRSAAQVA